MNSVVPPFSRSEQSLVNLFVHPVHPFHRVLRHPFHLLKNILGPKESPLQVSQEPRFCFFWHVGVSFLLFLSSSASFLLFSFLSSNRSIGGLAFLPSSSIPLFLVCLQTGSPSFVRCARSVFWLLSIRPPVLLFQRDPEIHREVFDIIHCIESGRSSWFA